MKILSTIYLSYLVTISTFASAPLAPQKRITPLKVILNEDISIKSIGFEGARPSIPKDGKVSLEREVYDSSKLNLIIILNDRSLAPYIKYIPNHLNQIVISMKDFKKASKENIWIWGVTPLSPCGGSTQLHLRFLNQLSTYTNIRGLFAWKFNPNDLPENTSFYLQPQMSTHPITKISSDIFSISTELDKQSCQINQGGKCPFVFRIPKVRNHSVYEVHFKERDMSNIHVLCPV